MSDRPFHSIDVETLQSAIARIHEQVAGGHGRVELTREGCDDICVMLSKKELQGLERALEIFASTVEYKSMCENVHRLALACGSPGCASEMLNAEL